MRKWQMLAASKVKMSSSEIKKMECRIIYDFSFVEVVQNNGKEMYKKMCCMCKVFYTQSPIDFVAFLVAVTG